MLLAHIALLAYPLLPSHIHMLLLLLLLLCVFRPSIPSVLPFLVLPLP